ncbi:uncharacterized protein HaLaN_04681, partial [Haematococcus lacustris]
MAGSTSKWLEGGPYAGLSQFFYVVAYSRNCTGIPYCKEIPTTGSRSIPMMRSMILILRAYSNPATGVGPDSAALLKFVALVATPTATARPRDTKARTPMQVSCTSIVPSRGVLRKSHSRLGRLLPPAGYCCFFCCCSCLTQCFVLPRRQANTSSVCRTSMLLTALKCYQELIPADLSLSSSSTAGAGGGLLGRAGALNGGSGGLLNRPSANSGCCTASRSWATNKENGVGRDCPGGRAWYGGKRRYFVWPACSLQLGGLQLSSVGWGQHDSWHLAVCTQSYQGPGRHGPRLLACIKVDLTTGRLGLVPTAAP